MYHVAALLFHAYPFQFTIVRNLAVLNFDKMSAEKCSSKIKFHVKYAFVKVSQRMLMNALYNNKQMTQVI